ncbi:MAG: nucleotide-binding protein [Planctomycetota bacterium]
MRRPRHELMDDPGLDPAEHAAALRGLRRINAVSGVVRTVARVLRELAEPDVGQVQCRAIDVACGGGDVAVGLNIQARREAGDLSAAITVDGCDVREYALTLSRRAADAAQLGDAASFWRWDAMSGLPLVGPGGRRYDVGICTLFLHHLETEQAVAVLRAVDEGCSRGGVVLDLRRGWWPWVCTWIGVRILSRSRVVHHDGPASVEAGWKRKELEDAARSAGLSDFRVTRSFPLRWKLVWWKPETKQASA